MDSPHIRCTNVIEAPPELMFTWEINKWVNADPQGDYTSDIELFGMPEVLGSSANLLGVAVVYMMYAQYSANEYHISD